MRKQNLIASFSAAVLMMQIGAVQAQMPIAADGHSKGFEATDERALHQQVEAFINTLKPSDANHELTTPEVSYSEATYDEAIQGFRTDEVPITVPVMKNKKYVQVPLKGTHQGANKKSSRGAKCADPDRIRIVWRGFIGSRKVQVGTEQSTKKVKVPTQTIVQKPKYLAVVTWNETPKQQPIIQIGQLKQASGYENALKNKGSERPCVSIPALAAEYAGKKTELCRQDPASKTWYSMKVVPGVSGGRSSTTHYKIINGQKVTISEQEFQQLKATGAQVL